MSTHSWLNAVSHSIDGQTAFSLSSNQIEDSYRAQVGLDGIGVVFRDRADFVARNRNGHFRAELLVDVVDAYLAQFVRGL